MSLAKRFKLKFPSVNIPSFRLCRLKSPSSLPKNPRPVNYRPSPVNPKALDITYPCLPAPPPSTPDHSFIFSSKTKIKSEGGGSLCRSISCGQHSLSDSSAEFPCCSVETSSFEASEKFYVKQKVHNKKKTKKPKESNEDDDDENSLVLLDSSRSFANPSNDTVRKRSRRRERKAAKAAAEEKAEIERDVRRVGETATWLRERETEGKKKVRESFAVVKKSEDPYEDFKRSMLEMIMGKQMFEASDLEELLHCFLTLNSKQYHGIIIEAFSEIWEILFSDDSHVKHRLSF
ncbi:hypothetical protein TIFTF001_056112 [Ficus carica]|uniref:Transcription repressor n=1 Tax=Ficus carica TaxID=3494 RepID=A0AA88EGA6_FICCA|nr:hypothetical protein TIFTF001_056111 [Ficus carica]GMN73549.1 hypothetical protein TIFTF001_056112 [Ficus carica]